MSDIKRLQFEEGPVRFEISERRRGPGPSPDTPFSATIYGDWGEVTWNLDWDEMIAIREWIGERLSDHDI